MTPFGQSAPGPSPAPPLPGLLTPTPNPCWPGRSPTGPCVPPCQSKRLWRRPAKEMTTTRSGCGGRLEAWTAGWIASRDMRFTTCPLQGTGPTKALWPWRCNIPPAPLSGTDGTVPCIPAGTPSSPSGQKRKRAVGLSGPWRISGPFREMNGWGGI